MGFIESSISLHLYTGPMPKDAMFHPVPKESVRCFVCFASGTGRGSDADYPRVHGKTDVPALYRVVLRCFQVLFGVNVYRKKDRWIVKGF